MMVFGRKKEASDEAGSWTRASLRRGLLSTASSASPLTSPGTPKATSLSATAHINSRVAKFDKNGDWVKSFGTPGSQPGQFNTPHSIASDAKGNIYVADRGNRRIQVFDHDGIYQRSIQINVPNPPVVHMWMGALPAEAAQQGAMGGGAPWAICITPGPGTQYLYSADAFPGRIYKLSLDGKVLGVLGSMGRQLKQFGWIHELACPSENEIYAGEILNWRVQKLVLHPTK